MLSPSGVMYGRVSARGRHSPEANRCQAKSGRPILTPLFGELVARTLLIVTVFALPLVDWLQRVGVPMLDLTDGLGQEAKIQSMDALFAAGSHYSPLGNRAVAAQRAQAVSSLVAPTSRIL
jgi:hypothetical protein